MMRFVNSGEGGRFEFRRLINFYSCASLFIDKLYDMAAAFVGLPVLIQLRSGGTAKGTVLQVDGSVGTIVLQDAQISTPDGTRIESRCVFGRNEVAGLELLAVKKAQPSPAPPARQVAQTATPQDDHRQLKPWSAGEDEARNEVSRNASRQQPQQRFPAAVHNYTRSPHASPSPHSSPKPAGQRSNRQRGTRGGSKRTGRSHADWDDAEGGDEADSLWLTQSFAYRRLQAQYTRRNQPGQMQSATGETFDEEFDFNAGLQSFDKSAVFKHIRESDTVDPALRLVAHNRNPARTPQTKLLPSESVLTVEELEAQQLDRQAALDAAPSAKKRGMTVEELEAGVASVGLEQEVDRGYEYATESARTLMTESGVAVPSVKLRQWREALSIADIETSPSRLQRLELAAYQLSTFVLTHLSLKFGLFPTPCPPQSRPSVLLLCTGSDKANVALRCGILLANRGCRVVALVEDGKAEELKTNLRVLSSAGGRIVRDLADLPPTFNLVIDALEDHETPGATSLSSSLSGSLPGSISPIVDTRAFFANEAAEWVNRLVAGVISISIDVPYGISHDEGTPTSSVFLTPTFVFSRALPRPGAVALLSPRVGSPQLFVADIGFSPSIWDRIGVQDFETGQWGAEGIVRVSFDGQT
ncbi:Edc3p [Sporobolomyces koalae]|uniref:Edc3p n=1 Tax=Sporobolomyces koalae TaxID=500713 RepID=UPI00317C4F0E